MTGDVLARLLADDVLAAPGAHDALTARLVEEAGFRAAFLSGATLSAVRLGRPDLGFLSASDVVDATRTVAGSTVLPLVVDADTGWGNAVHVGENVRRLERAGAAAIVIEDQVAPKRCGAMTGKDVVPVGEMVARVRAAVAARTDALVVARTDAAGIQGPSAARDRAAAYAGAGADLVFPAGVIDPTSLTAIREVTGAAGLVVNLSEAATPETGWPSVDDLAAAGSRLVIVPVLGLLAAVAATRDALASLRRDGSAALRDGAEWDHLNDSLGLPALLASERRWADPDHGQGATA